VVKLAKPTGTVKVPATVQAVLASRIDRLAPAEKELLQTLAVLGRQFTRILVQRVTLKTSDDLEQMLSHLQLSEFINEQPAVGEIEYSFKHALTQEVAYNSVLIERRKALHEQAGGVIEGLFADRLDDYVTDLAHHYSRSNRVAKAVDYLGRAARKALEQAAHLEVMEHVNRGLELLNRLPHSTERARNELELQLISSSSLLVALGLGSPQRERALARSLELCEQLGDSRIIEVLMSLASVRWSRSEPRLALQLLEKALALAEQAKEGHVLVAAHAGIAYQLFLLGRFEETREHLKHAIELSELSGGRAIGKFGYIFMLAQAAPALLPHVLLVLGYPIAALKQSKDALDTTRRGSVPYVMATALGAYVLPFVGLRDARDMAEHVEELAAITDQHEIPIYQAVATFCRAWLTADAGNVKEGVGEMRQSVTRLLGALPLVEWLVIALVEVCRKNELPDQGLATVEEALIRSEKTPYLQAEFHRLKAELTLLKDPRGEAEAEHYLRRAIEIAQRQAARLFELRATTSLARLLVKQGRGDQARTMLTEIYGWFTEGFDTADLKDAKALLHELRA
jgi:tetratricopeptide (TPR) repeat protein